MVLSFYLCVFLVFVSGVVFVVSGDGCLILIWCFPVVLVVDGLLVLYFVSVLLF